MVKKITLFVDINNNMLFLNNSVVEGVVEIPVNTTKNPTIFVEFAKSEVVVYGEQVLIEDNGMLFAYCFIDEGVKYDKNEIGQKLWKATISFLQDKQKSIINAQAFMSNS